MKRQSIFFTCILLISFLASHAQIKQVLQPENQANEEEQMAKEAVSLVLVAKLHEVFPSTTDEKWVKLKNSYYVNFKQNGILHNVYLNKKGKITAQIRYLSESDLPKNVLKLVNELEGCFSIGICKEIVTEVGSAHFITIDSKDYWKVVRVVNNELDIFQEFRKG